MKVNLTEEQIELRGAIERNLSIVRRWQELGRETVNKAFDEMNKAAHTLHMQLEPKPKHHRYMIENRGMQPEHPKFYYHIHPVEDLLAYLDDTSANDDPIDHTLGDEFDFRIYTRRWGHYDNYQLTRNEKGWHVSHLSYNAQGDKSAEDILKLVLGHDSVSFPVNIDSYMYSIWQRAQDEGLDHDQVQGLLNELANWISQTELSAPRNMLI